MAPVTRFATFRCFTAVCFVAALSACDDDPVAVPAEMSIRAEGRLERGAALHLTAFREFAALPDNAVTWSAEPAGTVTFTGATAALIDTGTVRITATAGESSVSSTFRIAAPPRIVFEGFVGGNRDLWAVDLDGINLQRLTTDPSEERSPSVFGSTLYFRSGRVAPPAIYSLPLGGGTETRVSTGTGTFTDPVISPDGTRLAFTRVSGVGRVFVSMPTGASAARLVTSAELNGIEASPAWSPDSRSIAYVSTAAGNADVYVTEVGGSPRRLTTQSDPEVQPAWSRDGARIAYIRAGAASELMIVPAAGGAPVSILTSSAILSTPMFLADGRIMFTMIENGASRLAWVDPLFPAEIVVVPTGPGEASNPVPIRN